MAASVGVDAGPCVETRAAQVIGESTAGLLDDERWCSVIPQVACEPDTGRDLTFSDAALVAPRPFVRPSADDTFESSPLLHTERCESWKAREPVRRQRR